MKKFCAMLLCILTSYLCFGQNDFLFSLAPRFSFTYGELIELLYDDDASQTLVSRLDWEQKPLFNIGLEAGFSYKNFLLSATFDYSFPIGTSYMYDFDDFNGDSIFDKCSKHPIERNINLNTELSFSYKLECSPAFTILPILNCQYLYNKFEAEKGLILYGQKTQGKKVYANKIDYSRTSLFIFSGVSINVLPIDNLCFSLGFLISPWGYQYAIDYHHGSGKDPRYPFTTYDYINSFFSKCKFMIAGDFNISSLLSIQLFTNFIIGFDDKGDCYTNYCSDEIYLSSQKSGASIHSTMTGISLKLYY